MGLRLDGHLMHAIADNALIGIWPCPIPANELAKLTRARSAATPLPPPPLAPGSIRIQHRVHANGRFMVAGQFIKVGPRHAGKLVTVVIEDTHFRTCTAKKNSLSGHAKNNAPITRIYVRGMGNQTTDSSTKSRERLVKHALRPHIDSGDRFHQRVGKIRRKPKRTCFVMAALG